MGYEYFIGISHHQRRCQAAAVDGWDWDSWWTEPHVLTCRFAFGAQPQKLLDWVQGLTQWPHDTTDLVSATCLDTLRAMDTTIRSVTLMRSEKYVDNGPHGSFAESLPFAPCLAAYQELERLCVDPPWQLGQPTDLPLGPVHAIREIARGLEAHAACSREVLFQFSD